MTSPPGLVPAPQTFTFAFTPWQRDFFVYHSHTSSAKQELKGLDEVFVILPNTELAKDHVDRDSLFTLQSWFFNAEGAPVVPFPPGGEFNFHTMT
ncbi:hypothetical protein BH11GEM2_BH11GEM2_35780 [soil metagenome]